MSCTQESPQAKWGFAGIFICSVNESIFYAPTVEESIPQRWQHEAASSCIVC
jgi:drug/metabolite transporter superfamily protein YnfA